MKHPINAENAARADTRAQAFVEARLQKQAINQYPGDMPTSLTAAYDIQDAAIALWPDAIVGWKAGRIMGQLAIDFGEDRLAGPIFAPCKKIRSAEQPIEMPVFQGGFAAVEGEVTMVIGQDADPSKTSYSTEDALAMVNSVHLGVEIASSPFSEINDHGPLVTISDFGNNYGLILGDPIPDWQTFALSEWKCTVVINGETVGQANPAGMPGGPLESVRFLLENTARRGLPMKKGMCCLTGAVTGVHQAKIGDNASVQMAGVNPINCTLVQASA
ncbi:MAG: hypothetical protein KTR25_20785 [Myxococcales bacterium]|nr:hypothetical protein [Myxococcales bacterium]